MPSVAYLPFSAGIYVWTEAGLQPALRAPQHAQAVVPYPSKGFPHGQGLPPPLAIVQLPPVKQVHPVPPIDMGASRVTTLPVSAHHSLPMQLPAHCPPDALYLWDGNRYPATRFQSSPPDRSVCATGTSPEGLRHNQREVLEEPKGRYRPRSVRTRLLREWLCANRLHPYPCHESKLQLARDSSMTLDQVTTWFSNTRRRIRKVGMWTWSKGRFHEIRLREPAQEKRVTDADDDTEDEASDKDDKSSSTS